MRNVDRIRQRDVERLTINEIDDSLASMDVLRRDIIKLRDNPEQYVRKQMQKVEEAKALFDRENEILQNMLADSADANATIDAYDAHIRELRKARILVVKRTTIERMKILYKAYHELAEGEAAGDPEAVSEESIVS